MSETQRPKSSRATSGGSDASAGPAAGATPTPPAAALVASSPITSPPTSHQSQKSRHSGSNTSPTGMTGGSAASAHAPTTSKQQRQQSTSPVANRSGARKSGGGHRGSASFSNMGGSSQAAADPASAMDNLQHLIHDMKTTPQQQSSSHSSPGRQNATVYSQGDRETSIDLTALGDQLAAREAQLQTQLQRELRLPSNLGTASRSGGLSSVGENAEVGFSPTMQQSSSQNRSIGPRFAGTAAFQSAIARHGGGSSIEGQGIGRTTGQDLRSLAHSRQLSLQNRFADLGYTPGSLSTAALDYEDGSTDDGNSVAEFMGTGAFDPTRAYQQQTGLLQDGGQYQLPHRRVGSDLSGLQHARHSTPQHTTDFAAERLALQQQIDILQLQQQQLLRQRMVFNPLGSFPGQAQQASSPAANIGGEAVQRRLHHQPAHSMSNFNFGGIGSIGSVSQQPAQHGDRGHNRRHSTNFGGPKTDAGESAPAGAMMMPNPAFSFPNAVSRQAHQPAAIDLTQPYSVVRGVGHFSHPSIQLSSALSPEYLMAGGGLLNLSTLGSGGELADGFGGGGAGVGAGRPGVAHNRSGSVANTSGRRIAGAPGVGGPAADLAQAQSQLATLHQFRTQASSGHMKTASYGAGGGGSISGFPPTLFGPQSAFGQHSGSNQQGGGSAASQRKALFGSYLPQASLAPLLAAGKIVVGEIRVDKRNRSDAYVSTEVLDSDIYISGSRDRNRALAGDIVAVELLDPQEVWLNKKAKEDKKKHKEENGIASRKPDKAKDDLEVEGAQLRLIEEEEDTEQAPPALAGHVVAIVERTPGQLFCGTIGLLRPSSAATKEKQQAERALRDGGGGASGEIHQDTSTRPKIVWHRPLNKTTPLIAIPADQAPAAFWEPGGQERYGTVMVTVAIKRWPITSLHPFGTLIEEIGVMGNVEAETQAILKDNLSTATEDIAENALKCIPPLPYSIPEREYEARRDFRGVDVFTIDPASAKDLDDAVSVTVLEGGLFEVGVHIADVSHFVKMNSALDREARKRCTSVYLVQRVVPMLPPTLSEGLCSLIPGVERLCFSAVFTMNKEARIIGTWFGRTIIKSCAKLAYDDAQSVIDGGSLAAGKIVPNTTTADKLSKDILTLHGLSKKMRVRRFDEGAIRVDNVKLNFRLDDNGLPSDATVSKGREANQLIEELMLTANIAVSQKIAAGMPDTAMLRRHEKPIERRLEGFQKRARQMGFDVDISSAGALYASLQRITDEKSRFALEALVTKGMQRAKYFCGGMTDISKFYHYALNVPVYTHFTSPIRRYADVLVHRQLDAVLQGADNFPIDREGMAKIAQQCNVKRDAAKLAQEQSQHLYLCLLIHDLTIRYGPVVRDATVVGILDAAFDVVVPEFGIEKRVHLDQIPTEHHTYDERTNELSIYWQKGVDTIAWLAENSDDFHLRDLHLSKERVQGVSQGKKTGVGATAEDASSKAQRDEAALFEEESPEEGEGKEACGDKLSTPSVQREKSRLYSGDAGLVFEGMKDPSASGGHRIQTVKMLQTIPVVLSARIGDKSPPVITVFAINPAAGRE